MQDNADAASRLRRSRVSFGPTTVAAETRSSPPEPPAPVLRAAPELVEAGPSAEEAVERRILAQRRRNRMSGAGSQPPGRSRDAADAGSSGDMPAESTAERVQRAARAKARREAKKEAGEAAQETLVTVAAESNVRANRVCI